MAQKDGQWTAFRATAAPGAVMFVPGKTNAQDWLKGRTDPKVSIAWGPVRTITACDGSLAVSAGAWTGRDGVSHGVFTTVWMVTPAGWRWVLDQGHDTPAAIPVPAKPVESRASCANIAKAAGAMTEIWPADDVVVQREKAMPDSNLRALPQDGEDWPVIDSGRSGDGTLRWEAHAGPADAGHSLAVYRWNGQLFELARVEHSIP